MGLDEAQNLRIYVVSKLLTGFGIIDLMHHFSKRLWCRHLKTWTQVRQETVLMESCDYILGTDRRLFKLVGIRDMRDYSSDHFALRAFLLQRPTRFHAGYLQVRHVLPLSLLTSTDLRMVDTKFQALKSLIPPIVPLDAPPSPPVDVIYHHQYG